MGEACKDVVHVDLDRSAKLEFHGSTVSSDGGLLAYRELDEVFALTAMADHGLTDLCTGFNVQHSMRALLRQSFTADSPVTMTSTTPSVWPWIRSCGKWSVGARWITQQLRSARWPASRPRCSLNHGT